MASPYTGPVFVDQSGAGSGTALNATDFNVFAVAPNFLMNLQTPSVSTLTLTFASKPQGVVNTGTTAAFVIASSLSVVLSGSHGSAQDYYVYLNSGGTYTVQNVNSGTAYTVNSPTLLGVFVCKATTNGADNSIVSTDTTKVIITPFPSSGMAVDGSNASSPVAFPGALTVATTLGVTGATTLGSTLGVTGNTTLSATTTMNGQVLLHNSSTPSIGSFITNGSLTTQTGNDTSGTVTIGVSPAFTPSINSAYQLCTVTFGTGYAATPLVQLTWGLALPGLTLYWKSVGTASFQVWFVTGNSLTPGSISSFVFSYLVNG